MFDWLFKNRLLESIAQSLADTERKLGQLSLQMLRVEQKLAGLAEFAAAGLAHQLEMERKIMETNEQVAEKITQLTGTVQKVHGEVQKLKEAVGNGQGVDPAIVAAVQGLEAALQGLDDLNPDEPTGDPVDPDQPQG